MERNDYTCEVARYLAQKVEGEADLELMVPVQLNIKYFCYRHAGPDVDSINADVVMWIRSTQM